MNASSPILMKELLSTIRSLADFDETKRLWLGRGAQISSFTEDMSHIFDDFQIDTLVGKTALELGVSPSVMSALRAFRDQAAKYHRMALERKLSDEQILNDPRWSAVVASAGTVVRALNHD